MARKQTVNLTDTIESWRTKSNSLSNYVGEPDNLTTTIKTDLVQAMNEIDAQVGDNVTRSKFSLVKNGSGTYITPSYDSNTGIFSFQVDPIDAGDVSNLDCGDVTTGTFNTQRIPGLAGTKITSGIVAAAYLPPVGSLSGTISASQLASVTSDNLTEGSTNLFFDSARVWTSLEGDSSINIDPATGKFTLTISETQANAVRSGAASLSAGTGVTILGSTVSIGQAVGTSSAVTFGNISGSAISGSTGTFSGAISGATVSGNMIASTSEATTGTDNTKVMTPLRVANAIAGITSAGVATTPSDGTASGSLSTGGLATRFISSDLVMSSGSTLTVSHNLSAVPDIIKYYLVLNSGASDGGYSAGDILDFAPGGGNFQGPASNVGLASYITSSTIGLRINSGGPGRYPHKSSSTNFFIDISKWKLRIVATKIL